MSSSRLDTDSSPLLDRRKSIPAQSDRLSRYPPRGSLAIIVVAIGRLEQGVDSRAVARGSGRARARDSRFQSGTGLAPGPVGLVEQAGSRSADPATVAQASTTPAPIDCSR